MLEPVRESLRTNKPLRWNRVHDLPDFVYFNHGIHVQKGVGCSSCHGAGRPDAADVEGRAADDGVVPRLPPPARDWRCGRKDEVFNMAWTAAGGPARPWARSLIQERHIPVDRLTNCSMCHR